MTRDQALAFAEALVRYIDICEGSGRPNSEHALTHLKAILGIGGVPTSSEVWQTRFAGSKFYTSDGTAEAKVYALGDFLEQAGRLIKEGLLKTP